MYKIFILGLFGLGLMLKLLVEFLNLIVNYSFVLMFLLRLLVIKFSKEELMSLFLLMDMLYVFGIKIGGWLFMFMMVMNMEVSFEEVCWGIFRLDMFIFRV